MVNEKLFNFRSILKKSKRLRAIDKKQYSKPTPSWQWNDTFNFLSFCRDHHLLQFPLFPIGFPSHSSHSSRDSAAQDSVVKNEKHVDEHMKLYKCTRATIFFLHEILWCKCHEKYRIPPLEFLNTNVTLRTYNFNSSGNIKLQRTSSLTILSSQRIEKSCRTEGEKSESSCNILLFMGIPTECWAPLRRSRACSPSLQN